MAAKYGGSGVFAIGPSLFWGFRHDIMTASFLFTEIFLDLAFIIREIPQARQCSCLELARRVSNGLHCVGCHFAASDRTTFAVRVRL